MVELSKVVEFKTKKLDLPLYILYTLSLYCVFFVQLSYLWILKKWWLIPKVFLLTKKFFSIKICLFFCYLFYAFTAFYYTV